MPASLPAIRIWRFSVAACARKPARSKVFDDIISGKRFDRPGLTETLDFCRAGDTICVMNLDRPGRSLEDLLETIDMRGLAFRSLGERLDTSWAAGELLFHIFGAITHFERRLIVERTREGIAAARAQGKLPGRPALDADKLASALKLIEAGIRPAQAAKQLGVGRSTLYRELALARNITPDLVSKSNSRHHKPRRYKGGIQ